MIDMNISQYGLCASGSHAQHHIFSLPTISNDNMANTRTCEVRATLVPFNDMPWINMRLLLQ